MTLLFFSTEALKDHENTHKALTSVELGESGLHIMGFKQF